MKVRGSLHHYIYLKISKHKIFFNALKIKANLSRSILVNSNNIQSIPEHFWVIDGMMRFSRTWRWHRRLQPLRRVVAVPYTWTTSSNNRPLSNRRRNRNNSQRIRRWRDSRRSRPATCRETRCLGIHFNRAHRVYTTLTDIQATWKWVNKYRTNGSRSRYLSNHNTSNSTCNGNIRYLTVANGIYGPIPVPVRKWATWATTWTGRMGRYSNSISNTRNLLNNNSNRVCRAIVWKDKRHSKVCRCKDNKNYPDQRAIWVGRTVAWRRRHKLRSRGQIIRTTVSSNKLREIGRGRVRSWGTLRRIRDWHRLVNNSSLSTKAGCSTRRSCQTISRIRLIRTPGWRPPTNTTGSRAVQRCNRTRINRIQGWRHLTNRCRNLGRSNSNNNSNSSSSGRNRRNWRRVLDLLRLIRCPGQTRQLVNRIGRLIV